MRTYCVYLRRVKPDSAAGSAEALGALGLVREDGSMDCGLLSRALGETMAVLMTCGGAINIMPVDIYSPINTMAAALAAVGLFLMIISLPSGADRMSRETT